MKKLLPLICIASTMLFWATPSLAQRSNMLSFGIGTSTYYGEMTDQFVSSYLKPSLSANFQKYITGNTAIRVGLAGGQIAASDDLSQTFGRQARGLHFRSTIVELHTAFVVEFIKDNDFGTITLGPHLSPYGFMGFGMFYHDPKARYQGVWYQLQPLGTEGQFLEGGKGPYSRLQISFPMGLGLNLRLTEFTGIGIEMGYRITMTDYLDDISTVYPNQASLFESRGAAAAALSMKTDLYPFEEGMIRGNPETNDGYMFMNFSFNYFLDKFKK
ncbi:MAG: DUF6089 family protein [Bacteroidia bacterium]|nr:DUF6089 family protein [Bacteroidia bacterium]